MNKKVIEIERVNYEVNKDARAYVEACESTFKTKIESIADYIYENKNTINVILLSGPSSSGKTTTSSILIDRLEELGIKSITISTDDFFIDRAKLNKNPDGTYDFENVNATNLQLLKECVYELQHRGEAFFPRYDFITGENIRNAKKIKKKENQILIIEGIHALNPIIADDVLFNKSLKLYVCVFSNFTFNGKILLTAQELRLTRRILRDCMTRGATTDYALQMWKHVLEGENKYIKPFENNADYIIDTTLPYEPLVYKDLIIPKLMLATRKVPGNMISDYSHFEGLDPHIIPSDSLLNEFVIL